MKSSEHKTDADKLKFVWDHNAAKVLQTKQVEDGKKKDMDEYFEFLEQFKPSRRELLDVVVYDEPFTLV